MVDMDKISMRGYMLPALAQHWFFGDSGSGWDAISTRPPWTNPVWCVRACLR